MNESSVEIISTTTSETQDGALRKTIISEGSLPIPALPSGYSLRQSLNQENTVQTQSCHTPQNQSGQMPQDHSGQTAQNQPGQTPQNQSGQIPQNQSGQTPQNQTNHMPQNLSGYMAQNQPNQMSQSKTNQTPQNQSGQMLQNQTNHMSQNLSGQIPQNQNLRPFAAATDLKCTPVSEHQQPNQVAYQAAMPYPLIKPECKNPQYAAAMLDNMGGQNSEMSAVSLYFYDHLITSAHKEVAETFHHISIVEMHHLEIFGTLALLLGENPRLWSKRGRGNRYFFWSPGYLRYPPFPIAPPNAKEEPDCRFTPPGPNPPLRTLLSQAIASEQEALNKYMQQTTWIKDVNICDNLRRIAADEQMHIEILTRLYHKY